MARAKVVHSTTACVVIFEGNKTTRPEPGTGVIKFPGGHVEVSRTSHGTYWAHIYVDNPKNVISSRIDYDRDGWEGLGIPPIPKQDKIQKLAVEVAQDKKEAELLRGVYTGSYDRRLLGKTALLREAEDSDKVWLVQFDDNSVAESLGWTKFSRSDFTVLPK